MRPHRTNKKTEHGTALLFTLISTAVIGTALASYLKLVEFQNRAVVRSQFWNAAIPLCEAGIEEALAHLNNVGDGYRGTNGWTLQGGEFYMARSLGDTRYEVWINSSNQPTITAFGYATESISQKEVRRRVLVTTTRYGSGMRGIITKLNLTMNGNCRIDSFDSEDPNSSTNGRYDPAKARDNGYAGSVYGNIDTGGGGVWGYVATGPAGQALANAGDAAWMASQTGIQPGHYQNDLNLYFPNVEVPFSGGLSPIEGLPVTVTNYTYLTTQTTSTTCPDPVPEGGVSTNLQSITTASKPSSWFGTLSTNTAPATSTTCPAQGTYIGNVTTRTVVTGRGRNATTTTYYDYTAITGYTYTTVTYTYNTVTTNSSTTTTTYAYVTDTGNYQMSSLSMSGQSQFLVRGDTVLYISGIFSMSGQSQIVILPGASLKIYAGGSVSLSGNGIMNLAEDATKFSILGLPTCTTISLSGNAAFTGTIYAPSAALDLNGGGNNVYDCVGAIVANSAAFHGHFNFHYDERLGRVGGKTQFKVAYWTEY